MKGADATYPEEEPAHKVFVPPSRLQAHEVTNSQFANFVAATGLYHRGGTKRWLSPIQREPDPGGLHVLVETRPHGDLENAARPGARLGRSKPAEGAQERVSRRRG